VKALILFHIVFFTSVSCVASSLIYVPVNPSFGGSPLNGSYLLNSAQSQNTYKDPDLEEDEKSALDDFNERLQRSLLSRLTSSLSESFTDESGNLIPGNMETSDFLISIVDEGNGMLSVTTTDKASGATTTFMVNSSL